VELLVPSGDCSCLQHRLTSDVVTNKYDTAMHKDGVTL
jgi:hypothetical protein